MTSVVQKTVKITSKFALKKRIGYTDPIEDRGQNIPSPTLWVFGHFSFPLIGASSIRVRKKAQLLRSGL
jgi:hypothetical protein